ncbi:uncharacterized protein UV8b_01682 [Ustilaginoidea virens]|uniref:Uncharacterized protein n=1 Tax=Ustilaginoidea virens TaxID=1159556 RepID=A0A8E5HL40_USTVR|nr:uncharacterized protein UV8b_01682 [Ustilaginoidea virens]QUC17441.1 hypothetical protein UV8b_01682 [Ustilaginoidea virens]
MASSSPRPRPHDDWGGALPPTSPTNLAANAKPLGNPWSQTAVRQGVSQQAKQWAFGRAPPGLPGQSWSNPRLLLTAYIHDPSRPNGTPKTWDNRQPRIQSVVELAASPYMAPGEGG